MLTAINDNGMMSYEKSSITALPKVKNQKKSEKIIIHGHTPEEKTTNDPFRINIDSGCYFSGKLSCVCLTDFDSSRTFITN